MEFGIRERKCGLVLDHQQMLICLVGPIVKELNPKMHIMDLFLWGRCLLEDEISALPAAMGTTEYNMFDLPEDNWQWTDSPPRVRVFITLLPFLRQMHQCTNKLFVCVCRLTSGTVILLK